MKIYTRTGDAGETSLFDGTRVSKDDLRVRAYGEVDELNAALGVAHASATHPEVLALLPELERDLFALGGQLANPAERSPRKVAKSALGHERVERLEQAIDALEEELPPLKRFILPGGSPGGAALHLARAVCRRAERAVVSLGRAETVSPVVFQYLNRLSDWLFVAARAENRRAGVEEVEW
ncbi:MAG: cob(I)yrinic acid a,c-diamide adenosyltransferase [Gemmatimonadota bacterium]